MKLDIKDLVFESFKKKGDPLVNQAVAVILRNRGYLGGENGKEK